MAVFDRYSSFRSNDKIDIVPFIEIRKKDTDKYIEYSSKFDRLDLLSYKYYENCDYGWLIMQANPEYGSIENLIPDKVVLRIPYPLEETISLYMDDIKRYKELNW